MHRQALASVLIEKRQDAEAGSILGLVFHKIPTPHLSWAARSQPFALLRPQPSHPPLLAVHLEAFHPAQSLHTLGVDREALTAQERRDPPIAITRMLLTELPRRSPAVLPGRAAAPGKLGTFGQGQLLPKRAGPRSR